MTPTDILIEPDQLDLTDPNLRLFDATALDTMS